MIASGSYPQDRDGMMAGHDVYKQVAEYLSSRGIAVLRVDDRGVGGSNGVYEKATTADFADDVIAAIKYLRTRPEIDTARIGAIGHSEGGASVSIAAAKCKDIKFIITMAGLMTDGLSSVIQQNKDIVETSPIPERDKRRYDDINLRMFNTVYKYADADSATLAKHLSDVYDEWKKQDDANNKRDGIDPNQDHFRFPIYMYTMQATSPWYRFFIRYNPADYLSKVTVPVLALNGTRDVMVNCEQNLNNVKRYLKHNKDVTTVALPNLNHLFLPCEKGTQDEYRSITAPVSQEALEIIAEWTLKR